MSARPELKGVPDRSWDLEGIVAELGELRTISQRRRHAGRLPELPSRSAVIAMVDALVSALYPSHFGPIGLSEDGLDLFVADTVDQALRSLRQQVRRELQLIDADNAQSRGDLERAAALRASCRGSARSWTAISAPRSRATLPRKASMRSYSAIPVSLRSSVTASRIGSIC